MMVADIEHIPDDLLDQFNKLALVDGEIYRQELRDSEVITKMVCDRLLITYALRKVDGKAIVFIEMGEHLLILLPEGFA